MAEDPSKSSSVKKKKKLNHFINKKIEKSIENKKGNINLSKVCVFTAL